MILELLGPKSLESSHENQMNSSKDCENKIELDDYKASSWEILSGRVNVNLTNHSLELSVEAVIFIFLDGPRVFKNIYLHVCVCLRVYAHM